MFNILAEYLFSVLFISVCAYCVGRYGFRPNLSGVDILAKKNICLSGFVFGQKKCGYVNYNLLKKAVSENVQQLQIACYTFHINTFSVTFFIMRFMHFQLLPRLFQICMFPFHSLIPLELDVLYSRTHHSPAFRRDIQPKYRQTWMKTY